MAGAAQRKLNPKVQKELVELLRRGHYLKSAAAYVGVTERTLHRWIEWGNEARARVEFELAGDESLLTPMQRRYMRFAEAIGEARDYGEAWLVEQALNAAESGNAKWTAYVTILERSRPERWRRRSRLDDEQGKRSPLDVSNLSSAERAALRDLIAKARGGSDA